MAAVVLSIALAGVPTALGSARGTSPASTLGASDRAATAPYVVHTRSQDPRRSRGLYVDPGTQAARAGSAFSRIARKAQPMWVTDAAGSPGQAKAAVKDYVSKAKLAGRTPLLTVYNIPDRDCGMYSSPDDQITDGYYRTWVTKVADGLRGSKPIVVLEPDAISFIGNPACTGRGDRLGLLRYANRKLTKAGAWVYLDAGHSAWTPPKKVAPLLKQAGVGLGRGLLHQRRQQPAHRRREVVRLGAHPQAARDEGDRHEVRRGRLAQRRRPQGTRPRRLLQRPGGPPRCGAPPALQGATRRPALGQAARRVGRCLQRRPGRRGLLPDGACRLLGRTYYDPVAQACRD